MAEFPPAPEILGRRVGRGPDWKWGEQGAGGDGTVVRICRSSPGWVKVVWDNGDSNNYRWGAESAHDLSVGDWAEPAKLARLRVRRGRDWKWGDQDGASGLGEVQRSPRPGVVEVLWYSTGKKHTYRWGIEGAFDLAMVSDKRPRGSASAAPAGGLDDAPSGGDQPIDVLWNALQQLHRSVNSDALGPLSLQRPVDVRAFYNTLWKYECAIKINAQTPEWKAYRRQQWEAEMKGPHCDAAHAATCLLAVEMNILGSAQVPTWREERKPWLRSLVGIGGKPMEWRQPAPMDSDSHPARPEQEGDLETLWTCLVQLHKSLDPEVLGQVQLSKPTNMAGFYNALWKYECAINIRAQTPQWKESRRKVWEREMKSPRCDTVHAATMLVAVEMNIVGGAQKPSWREDRKEWLRTLARLGAWELHYEETPSAPAGFSFGGGASSGGGGGDDEIHS